MSSRHCDHALAEEERVAEPPAAPDALAEGAQTAPDALAEGAQTAPDALAEGASTWPHVPAAELEEPFCQVASGASCKRSCE